MGPETMKEKTHNLFRLFEEISNPHFFDLEETGDGCLYFRYKGQLLMRYYPDTTYFMLYGDVETQEGWHHRIAKAAIQMGIPFRFEPEAPYGVDKGNVDA